MPDQTVLDPLHERPILGPPVAQHCTRCAELVDTSQPHTVYTLQIETWQGLMIDVHDADVVALLCPACAPRVTVQLVEIGASPAGCRYPYCDGRNCAACATRAGLELDGDRYRWGSDRG